MSLEEEDIFKDSEIPLADEEEEEEMEEEEEEEELETLEKENEPEHEDEDIEEDEDEIEVDDDDDNDDENGSRDPEESSARSVSTKDSGTGDVSKVQAFYNTLMMKARLSDSYDIIPKVGIPQASAIHSLALPKSCKWFFTGGEDGFIRKYDFFASIDGEIQLTSAQKHSLVDLITNAGVLQGYWENEVPIKKSETVGESYAPKLSPVYSLAVENQCLWILSGLSTGGINLQSVRHNEGSIIHHFEGHRNTVSVLELNQDQDKFLSGSWDNNILQWDLNTGKPASSFQQCTGQVSSLQYRPFGGIGLDQIQQAPSEDDDMDSLFGGDDDNADDTQAGSKKAAQDQNGSSNALDQNVFMSSSIDGSLYVWDIRVQQPALRLKAPKGTPPWCVSACWSQDGDSIFAGRRNSCVEEFSLKMPFGSSGDSKAVKTLKFPSVSGAVTSVKTLPNQNHVVCGSFDNIRMYDLRLYEEAHKKTPFLIIPGHHGGTVCDILFDPTYRYMISASGNRGWQGSSTENAFVYEITME